MKKNLELMELLYELDRENPVRYPKVTDSERTIFYNAGRRSVIDELYELYPGIAQKIALLKLNELQKRYGESRREADAERENDNE